jgi:hypothetical protein
MQYSSHNPKRYAFERVHIASEPIVIASNIVVKVTQPTLKGLLEGSYRR